MEEALKTVKLNLSLAHAGAGSKSKNISVQDVSSDSWLGKRVCVKLRLEKGGGDPNDIL